MKSARYFWITVLSCLLILSCNNLFGQATATSSLQGTVVDKSQAVLSGAEVTLTNKANGAVRTTKTDNTGGYKFESLPAGIYDIKVANAGFGGVTAKDVETRVGTSTTQNFTLTPGAVNETVEVTTTAPLVDQTKMDVSTNITPEQITDLPLIGRDIADLAYLAPGVKAADSYDPTKNRYSILSVNGDGGRNV